jgi:hypothetical protein
MPGCILQSSGSPALDQETLAMLVRAHPMPRPPQEPSHIASAEVLVAAPLERPAVGHGRRRPLTSGGSGGGGGAGLSSASTGLGSSLAGVVSISAVFLTGTGRTETVCGKYPSSV